MSEIKSQKAKEYLSQYCEYITPHTARQAIIIAETEAEERHAKLLEMLMYRVTIIHERCCPDKVIRGGMECCTTKKIRLCDYHSKSNCKYLKDFQQRFSDVVFK